MTDDNNGQRKYAADYDVLASLMLLQHYQDAGDEETFACGLKTMWMRLAHQLPPELLYNPDVCIIHSFFTAYGRMSDAVALNLQVLKERVPPDAHERGLKQAEEAFAMGKSLLDPPILG